MNFKNCKALEDSDLPVKVIKGILDILKQTLWGITKSKEWIRSLHSMKVANITPVLLRQGVRAV